MSLASTFGERRKLLPQQLNRTFPAECPHCLVIAPDQVFRKLTVEFFKTAEMLPVVKISLVISVASLYFSIVPWCPRRYQLMLYTCIFKHCIKGAFCIITYALQVNSVPLSVWTVCILKGNAFCSILKNSTVFSGVCSSKPYTKR